MRLSEVAQVTLDYPDPARTARLNAHPTIGIFVRKQSDANVVTTANAVKKELAALGPTLPPGTSVTVASDATMFIKSSLAETRLNLVESILTTSLVLFLFLRSWRSSLIVLVAIPVSLVGTFFAMWAFHFTLNVVSLMALGLCIGILVDDSIVILENIDRHIAHRPSAAGGGRQRPQGDRAGRRGHHALRRGGLRAHRVHERTSWASSSASSGSPWCAPRCFPCWSPSP